MDMQAPPADPAMTEGEQAPAGYVIEIAVSGDNAITVSVESAEAEMGEGGAPEPQGTPVKSIRDALSLVIDIYKNAGQMQDHGDADFAAGFGKPATEPGQMA